jgi:hypothetical protein
MILVFVDVAEVGEIELEDGFELGGDGHGRVGKLKGGNPSAGNRGAISSGSVRVGVILTAKGVKVR